MLALKLTDINLVPKFMVRDTNPIRVSEIVEFLRSGNTVPPVIVQEGTLILIDGFHRFQAYKILFGEDTEATIPAEERAFFSEEEMLLEAARMNTIHGANLTSWEKKRFINKGLELGMDPDRIAEALHVTPYKLEDLKLQQGSHFSPHVAKPSPVPLKRSVRHMRGQTITLEQQQVIPKLSGLSQSKLLGDIITLIETDMLDKNNSKVMERVEKLHGLMGDLLE